jgi:hypothetical protein
VVINQELCFECKFEILLDINMGMPIRQLNIHV